MNSLNRAPEQERPSSVYRAALIALLSVSAPVQNVNAQDPYVQEQAAVVINQVPEGMLTIVIQTLGTYLAQKNQLESKMEMTPKGKKLMDPSKYGLIQEDNKRILRLLNSYGIQEPSQALFLELTQRTMGKVMKNKPLPPQQEAESFQPSYNFVEPHEVLTTPRVSQWDDENLPPISTPTAIPPSVPAPEIPVPKPEPKKNEIQTGDDLLELLK